eukprot:313264-Chlamydomonas_euryale.AAC.4
MTEDGAQWRHCMEGAWELQGSCIEAADPSNAPARRSPTLATPSWYAHRCEPRRAASRTRSSPPCRRAQMRAPTRGKSNKELTAMRTRPATCTSGKPRWLK